MGSAAHVIEWNEIYNGSTNFCYMPCPKYYAKEKFCIQVSRTLVILTKFDVFLRTYLLMSFINLKKATMKSNVSQSLWNNKNFVISSVPIIKQLSTCLPMD